MKRFVVIGLGSFGERVARTLAALGARVSAVDRDAEKVARAATFVRAVSGDATDPRVLEEAGARDAEVGIVSTGRDVTASALAAVELRNFGVEEIHVKVISGTHEKILERLGISSGIFPERESADRLARQLASSALLDFVELGPDLAVQEMAVPNAWIGQSLRELELPRRHGVSVVAVRDYLTGSVTPVPSPDRRLTDSDSLLVAGGAEPLAKVSRLSE